MDFEDSPADAEFRSACRRWLEANAPRRSRRSGLGPLAESDPVTEERHVAEARAWQAVLADAGWAAIAWPAEHGGRGGTPRQGAIFAEEQAAFDAPDGVFAQGIGMAGPTIIAHGSEEQKARHLPPMLRGETIWCQLFSEPGAGSDLASLSTRAVRDGDHLVVTGQKVWTSTAQHSERGMLLVRTNPDAPKHRGITFILLDMSTPGVEVRPLRQITGSAHFNEVFLTDVRVPIGDVLGDIDDGWRVTMTTLTAERSLIGAAGADASEQLIALAAETGAASNPIVRQRLARVFAYDRILRYLGWRAQTAIDRGGIPGPEASVMKLVHSRQLELIGDLGLEILGPAGTLLPYDDLDAHPEQIRFLTQWASRIGGGTDQVQRNIVAERVLGLPRDPGPERDTPFRDLPLNL